MVKSIAKLVILGLAAGAAFAQSSTDPAKKPAAKTATAPARSATQPARSTTAPASAAKAKTPAKSAAAPVKTASAAKAKTETTSARKPMAEKKAMTSTPKAAAEPKPSAAVPEKMAKDQGPSKRDPFVNPIRQQEEMAASPANCSGGARCLVISQVVLKGVVKTQNGMIAMVENGASKQYNLREKDTVLNGVVQKITNDSIIFSETVTDLLGRKSQKEVVKRVTVPAV